jgi:hypothetical protein
MYIDDLIVKDESGSYNNDFQGDLRVATIVPVADTAEDGWTRRPRQKIGEGVMQTKLSFLGTTNGNSPASPGTGDFTFEGFFRFLELPTGTNLATLMSQWDESDNARSWRLYKAGPSRDNGGLVFEVSTDGQSGTATKVIDVAWEPRVDVWYNITVERISGTTTLYVDGFELASASDSNDYFGTFSGISVMSVGGAPGNDANTDFHGFFDEIRWTNGVGRYNGNFSPTTVPFGRNDVDDPDYNSVTLLMGFDNEIADDGPAGRPIISLVQPVPDALMTRLEPNDRDNSFSIVDSIPPVDDTFLEAAFLFATGTLTFTGQPADSDTFTLGTQTYTYVDTLSTGPTVADEILIGASLSDTLDNTVAAINGGAGEGTTYSTGTVANTDATAALGTNNDVLATAITQGADGNSVATTETGSTMSWGDTTLTGGADVPGPTMLRFGPLPPDTTAVRAIQLVNRMRKSDSGDCDVTISWELAGGTEAAGTEHTLTIAEQYYNDIFEEDPVTSAAITPSSFTGSFVKIDRTDDDS